MSAADLWTAWKARRATRRAFCHWCHEPRLEGVEHPVCKDQEDEFWGAW